MRYDPSKIEPKWQTTWAEERTWEVGNEPDDRPASYVLEMLPYPSGEPHIGHLKVYSVGDAIAHYHRALQVFTRQAWPREFAIRMRGAQG